MIQRAKADLRMKGMRESGGRRWASVDGEGERVPFPLCQRLAVEE